MKKFNYYIKERHNPQLVIYFTAMGQMTIKAAKTYEKALYGFNIMYKFETKKEYNIMVNKLKQEGKL